MEEWKYSLASLDFLSGKDYVVGPIVCSTMVFLSVKGGEKVVEVNDANYATKVYHVWKFYILLNKGTLP